MCKVVCPVLYTSCQLFIWKSYDVGVTAGVLNVPHRYYFQGSGTFRRKTEVGHWEMPFKSSPWFQLFSASWISTRERPPSDALVSVSSSTLQTDVSLTLCNSLKSLLLPQDVCFTYFAHDEGKLTVA